MLVAGVIGFWAARALELTPPPSTILYISPVRFLSGQPFYSEFLDKLIQESSSKNFEVTVWEPDEDWVASRQQRLLKQLLKQQKLYAGVVFTPFIESSRDPKPEEAELFRFLVEAKGLNAVLFDTDLSDDLRNRLIKQEIAVPPCVSGQEWEAGKLAALAMTEYFHENQITDATVAVFDKLQPMQRSISFRKYLQLGAEDKHIKLEPFRTWFWSGQQSMYGRANAREIAESNLTDDLDAVFSGNDVTALGVRDVILARQTKRRLLSGKKTVVVGYDGIHDVRELLNDRSEPVIVNAVDVNIAEQAHSVVSVLEQLNSKKRDQALRHKLDETCYSTAPHLIRTAR
jgi:DNA-binding LacI/PurR family transcriptional regulator